MLSFLIGIICILLHRPKKLTLGSALVLDPNIIHYKRWLISKSFSKYFLYVDSAKDSDLAYFLEDGKTL